MLMKKLVGIILLVAFTIFALADNVRAQVVNGDFTSGTNGWNIVFPPGNVYFPAYGLDQLDMDGPGPLPVSQAFVAQVGDTSLLNLEQKVNLTAGVQYSFHADLAMVPHAYNADGGTLTVYIGAALLISYSFGYVSSLTQIKYATLSTNYMPAASGPQTLSIHFSRGYGEDGSTPSDYIDNISLQAPAAPLLKIQLIGGKAVLTWTNPAYSLQIAPLVMGTFTNIPSVASPFTNAISGPAGYFRLIGN
jgi:hypothetical protein